jgi:hypothetical protein
MKFIVSDMNQTLSLLLYPKTFASNQRGQALTEFLMMSLVLVPLILLIPMIGKYQEISHASLVASRYVAWDATLNNPSTGDWKPQAQLASEVKRRFFSSIDAPIKTGDVAGNSEEYRNVAWTTPAGKPLIERFENIAISFGADNSNDPNQGFTASSNAESLFNYAQWVQVGARTIDLQSRGIFRANVSVPLVNLPEHIEMTKPFDQINLVMNRHTSLLLDPWTGRSPEMVDSKTKGWAPIGRVLDSAVGTLVGGAIEVIDLGDVAHPDFANLEKWKDMVPADRLLPSQ